MDPNSFFPVHNHPEHQLMMVLRGALEQNVTDQPYTMRGESNHVLLMPGLACFSRFHRLKSVS